MSLMNVIICVCLGFSIINLVFTLRVTYILFKFFKLIINATGIIKDEIK